MHLKELDANLIVVLDALLIDASVTKAAERLGRSPSAVSHALANLRHIFNDELFVRAGQRLAPTARAKELAPSIHIIVSGLESLLRPTTPFNPGTQERRFIFAGPELTELYLLPALRREIKSEAPNITLDRVPLEGPGGFENLRLGRTDFALSEGEPGSTVADITWQLIRKESYVTLCKKSHELVSKTGLETKKLTPKEFASTPHIIIQASGLKNGPVEEVFLKRKLPQWLITRVSSSLTGLLLALETGGLVTIPRLHASTITEHLAVTEVTLPFTQPAFEIYLGWHRSFERDECHQWLRQIFLAHFSNAPTAE